MKLHNKRHTKLRIAAIGGSLLLCGGLAVMASGATGAYFSDTHAGAVTGSIGTVQEATNGGSGGNGLDLSFVNLLPGEPQSVTANYGNTGTGNQDFYITFPNATALSALNNLGRYGTLHVSSSGTGAVGDVFDSANLNDNSGSCGGFSPSGCWPLPNQLKIASGVAPGSSGSVTITFNYASALGGSATTGGGTWNTYPVAGQVTTNPSDGTGNGLPYDIVATQVGITPGAPGTKP
jgi:hypothetical protein